MLDVFIRSYSEIEKKNIWFQDSSCVTVFSCCCLFPHIMNPLTFITSSHVFCRRKKTHGFGKTWGNEKFREYSCTFYCKTNTHIWLSPNCMLNPVMLLIWSHHLKNIFVQNLADPQTHREILNTKSKGIISADIHHFMKENRVKVILKHL